MTAYHICMPESIPNPGKDYAVVEYQAWLDAIDRGVPVKPECRHIDLDEAQECMDKLNSPVHA